MLAWVAGCSGGSDAGHAPSSDATTAFDGGAETDATDATLSEAGQSQDSGLGDGRMGDATSDGAPEAQPECAPWGAPGQCLEVDACASLSDHTSIADACADPPGACCIVTPNVADNPPVPAGWELLMQSLVTAELTAWAVQILDDPATYPMFATATKVFGSLTVMARVEWHPPDFQDMTIHRGVTLYVAYGPG